MEWRSEDATECEVVCSPGCIAVSGEIDIANATMIGRRIRARLTPGRVMVDCRAVTFVDVAGFRMLTELGIAAIAAGAVIYLRCSPAVMGMVHLFGRPLPGLVLDRDDYDSPESLR